MSAAPIDYSKLAAQAGAVSSTPPPAAASSQPAPSGGVDYTKLAAQAGAIASTPPPAPRTWTDSVGDAASEYWKQVNPISAVLGLANAVNHPIDTGKALLSAQGEVGKKAAASFQQGDYVAAARHGIDYLLPVIGPQIDQAGDLAQSGQYAKSAGQTAGIATNLAAPELLKGANVRLPVGELPERLYQSALKPSPALASGKVAGMVQSGLENQIPVSADGVSKLNTLINNLGDQVKAEIEARGPQPWPGQVPGQKLLPAPPQETILPASSADRTLTLDSPYAEQSVLRRPQQFPATPAKTSGATIDPRAVAQRADQLKSRFAAQVAPDADLQAIEQTKNEFLQNNPGPIPASAAQDIKSGTYQQLKDRAYGTQSTATVEAQKALARGIKEELEAQFPEIQGLNAQQGQAASLEKALTRAVQRIDNHNLVGLGGTVAGAGGAAAGAVLGGTPGAAGGATVAAILKQVIDNPNVKSRLAYTLSSARKGVTVSAAAARIAAYSDQLGNAMPPNEPDNTLQGAYSARHSDAGGIP
jgi:hypothetical protein